MKIVDDKGRLFGLVNIVDFLVLLAVLLVLGGAYYKYKGRGVVAGADKTVRLTVLSTVQRPEVIDDMKVGDRMVSGSSYTGVVIKDIKTRQSEMVATDSAGRRVMTLDPYYLDAIVTLEGTTNVSGATINMGGQEIRSGKDYFVKSLKYEVKGTIIEVEVVSAP
ncbi:MAG: DUF4330 domain-containing protein [Eubacteriales bacterium]